MYHPINREVSLNTSQTRPRISRQTPHSRVKPSRALAAGRCCRCHPRDRQAADAAAVTTAAAVARRRRRPRCRSSSWARCRVQVRMRRAVGGERDAGAPCPRLPPPTPLAASAATRRSDDRRSCVRQPAWSRSRGRMRWLVRCRELARLRRCRRHRRRHRRPRRLRPRRRRRRLAAAAAVAAAAALAAATPPPRRGAHRPAPAGGRRRAAAGLGGAHGAQARAQARFAALPRLIHRVAGLERAARAPASAPQARLGDLPDSAGNPTADERAHLKRL